jgi:hypothetical protein
LGLQAHGADKALNRERLDAFTAFVHDWPGDLTEPARMSVQDTIASETAAETARHDDPSREFYVRRPAERKKSRFQRFLARECTQAVMSTLGALLNSRNAKIYLAYRPDSHFDFDSFPHFSQMYRDFTHGSGDSNRGDLVRLYMLLLNIARVLKEAVPGHFAELGVYKGNTARILAQAARDSGRRLYLFDTFGGFDAADFDPSEAVSKSFRDTSLVAVKAFIGTEAVEYIAGRFPDSLSGIEMPERFAIVHLDCDLYKPMAAGLSYFYPRLSAGGLLILHDYSSGHWGGCAQAIDEFLKDKPERPVLMPDKAGTAIVVKL